MWANWFATDWRTVVGVVLTTAAIYALIIIYIRIAGLRSLSKMTAPDFAMTVAVGSLFASSIAAPSPTVLTAVVAFGMLFLGQVCFAQLRQSKLNTQFLTNDAQLLVFRGRLLPEAMSKCLVSEDDIRSKLREANALSLQDVQAVVFESTGDVSVLHGDGEIDPWVMQDVNGWAEVAGQSRPADAA